MCCTGPVLLVLRSEAKRRKSGRAKVVLHGLFVSGLFDQGGKENRVADRAGMTRAKRMVSRRTSRGN